MKFKVYPKVFEKYPDVIMGVIYISDLDNSENSATMDSLRREEVSVREWLKDKEIVELDTVKRWREIYKSFGSKPSKYKSSIEALLRREKKGEDLPDINAFVNFYNAQSLHYKIPFGAEDLSKIVGDVELTFADGTDACKLIGGKEHELADKGEVVYKDNIGVICRKWNWREADRTKITEDTNNAVLVFEINSGDVELAQKVLADTVAEIQNVFGIKSLGALLDVKSPEWEIPFETKQAGEKIVVEKKEENVKVARKKVEKKKYYPKTEIERVIYQAIIKALGEMKEFEGFIADEVELEHPTDESHGDFSTNIAMKLAKKLKKNPREIADNIVEAFNTLAEGLMFEGDKGKDLGYLEGYEKLFQKAKVAGPGFINFFIGKEKLKEEVRKVLEQQDAYGNSNLGKGEHVLIEHTSANPNKALHIGHIRNNTLGNSIIRLFESVGYQVTADYIVNDRGASISKVMWGYLNFAQKDQNWVEESWDDVKEKLEKSDFNKLLAEWFVNPEKWLSPEDFPELTSDMVMEKVYVLASSAAKELDWVKEQISKILVSWEEEEPMNRKLWKQVIDWVLEGQLKTLTRLGSRTDHFWYESEFYKEGKEIVEKGIEKGVFRRDGKAIITNFKDYGLSDTIVIKSDGTALYLTQDLKLTQLKAQKFPSVKYIWVVGAEQSLTLKQAFLADHLLGIADKKELYHLGYGLFASATGKKIGSRAGNVVSADGLLDQVVEKAAEAIRDKDVEYSEAEKKEIASKVGIGALKYSILKVNSLSTVKFDVNEALSFEGNSGPYLQYTYARAKSILGESTPVILSLSKDDRRYMDSRVKPENDKEGDDTLLFSSDSEMAILRTLYKFPEVVQNAAENYAPNYVVDYIFDLAQKFNAFYRECPVLKADEDIKNSRLMLTAAVAQVIKNGLYLLGIETLERM